MRNFKSNKGIQLSITISQDDHVKLDEIREGRTWSYAVRQLIREKPGEAPKTT